MRWRSWLRRRRSGPAELDALPLSACRGRCQPADPGDSSIASPTSSWAIQDRHSTPPYASIGAQPTRAQHWRSWLRSVTLEASVDALRFLLVTLAAFIDRRNEHIIAYLRAENEVLRVHLDGRRIPFTDPQRRKLARVAERLGRVSLRGLRPIVTPETLLRWYRELVARKYNGSANRASPGRPPVSEDLRDLVIQLARENDGWGYSRILGALKVLGHDISRSSIRRILAEAGIEPAPNRGMTWAGFLKAHWAGLFATDFFHVEVLTLRGLVRYQVLFVIELATRRVKIAGVVKDAYGEWTQNVFRGLTFDGEFLDGATHIIMDRDPVFSGALRRLL